MTRKKRSKDEVKTEKQAKADEKVIPINGGESEEAVESVEETTSQAEVEPSESEEERLRARVVELEEQKLLAMADLDNYKKRMARQFEEVIRNANEKLMGDFLDVLDNFERALQHSADGGEGDDANAEAFRKGTELIYNQMNGLLGKYNVRSIEALGKPFDPNHHEAMMQVESEDYDEGVVALEIGKGYMMGDRVLRFAKVGVSKGKPE